MKDREGRGWLRLLAEGGVIVGSILLALALDAWWDGVQQDSRRDDLVQSLTVDFETTRSRLATSIGNGDLLISRTMAFLRDASLEEPPSVDSLRFLAGSAFAPFEFQPASSSYVGAQASGDLQLLESRELIEAFAEFDQSMAYFEDRSRVFLDWYYLDGVAEIRSELGSLFVLTGIRADASAWVSSPPAAFSLSDSDFLRFAKGRRVYSVFETGLTLRGNLVRGLGEADRAAARVLEELRRMGGS